jgi:hypothetical protein
VRVVRVVHIPLLRSSTEDEIQITSEGAPMSCMIVVWLVVGLVAVGHAGVAGDGDAAGIRGGDSDTTIFERISIDVRQIVVHP